MHQGYCFLQYSVHLDSFMSLPALSADPQDFVPGGDQGFPMYYCRILNTSHQDDLWDDTR